MTVGEGRQDNLHGIKQVLAKEEIYLINYPINIKLKKIFDLNFNDFSNDRHITISTNETGDFYKHIHDSKKPVVHRVIKKVIVV